MMRKLLVACLLMAFVLGTSALLLSSDAMAGKGGKGGGKPKPPPCDCAPTVGPCVLEECGFDCVYVCPFPD